MGTGPFAVPTLDWLCQSPHQVLALVTRPAKAAVGRHRPPRPMYDLACQRAIPVYEPASVNAPSAVAWLQEQHPDLLVVCDYGEILSAEVLGTARLGGINLHGSLLPKYRGAAPIAWAILNGETVTGVTVIHMTPRLDAGPILVQRSTTIDDQETAIQLELRLARLGVEAVQEALKMLENWDGHSPLGTPQDAARATKAPRLTKAQGQVNWNWPARRIYNQVRALVPWPGTYTYWSSPGRAARQQRLILHQVSVVPPEAWNPQEPAAAPGTVVAADPERLWVQAGEGTVLAIHQLQPEGKRVMHAAEFLRGHPLRVGDRFA